jgi:tRNA G37 N-methylase Trm5
LVTGGLTPQSSLIQVEYSREKSRQTKALTRQRTPKLVLHCVKLFAKREWFAVVHLEKVKHKI